MSKRLIYITTPLLILLAIYFLGPAPSAPKWDTALPEVPKNPAALVDYVARQERNHPTKPDNEATIVWANDSVHTKTPWAVVYLHGFSASRKEGAPVHRKFAKEFGCNLYLARLAEHGLDTIEAMVNASVDRWWASAKEALEIGKSLGDRVILMSCSTGGTLSLMLAATYPEDVAALINMSPNIAVNNSAAFILNNPWGLQIARMVKGSDYDISSDMSDERKRYWYQQYRLEAAVQLQEMLEDKMNHDTFSKVKVPSLTLYYYKNEEEQDPTVQVSAILDMVDHLGTPKDMNKAVAIPNAGAHVLGSPLTSKDVDGVYHEMETFAKDVLHMTPVE